MATQINGMLKWVTLPFIPCAWICYCPYRLDVHVKFKIDYMMGHSIVSSLKFICHRMNSIGKK